LIKLILCSAQRASMSLTYSASVQLSLSTFVWRMMVSGLDSGPRVKATNAKVSLALVESLGALPQSAGKSVVDHGLLENVLLWLHREN
jgi:hypothetical protein